MGLEVRLDTNRFFQWEELVKMEAETAETETTGQQEVGQHQKPQGTENSVILIVDPWSREPCENTQLLFEAPGWAEQCSTYWEPLKALLYL